MKKQYVIPTLIVSRLAAVAILTVSTDDEWKDEWDEALEEENADDQA